ncbi:MAG TPA: cytochrome c-type biogenesis protein [Candidatus Sulfotelmatobacter sp.]|nr:cytochrome c-type biogenesis protein [Candidatus Sulfotelmatobacter sp.]
MSFACRLALLALLLVPAGRALALSADQTLADPKLEARAEAVAGSLRCLVCQNESILDSNADLARDLRRIVRERIAAGDSDEQARQFLVARYGDWVLLKPPFKPSNYALWLGPPGLLLAAAFGIAQYYRRKRGGDAAAEPLNADERRELEALLDDGRGR